MKECFLSKHTLYQLSTEHYVWSRLIYDMIVFVYSLLLSKGNNVDDSNLNPSPALMSDLLQREPPHVKMTALMNSRPHSFTP